MCLYNNVSSFMPYLLLERTLRALTMHGGEISFGSSRIKSSSHCLVSGPVLAAAVFTRERSASRYVAPRVGRELSRSAEVSARFYGRRGGMFRKCQLFRFFQMPSPIEIVRYSYT